MKKNSGVSIITLVITIVIIIILAGLTIYLGAFENMDKASETMAYNEIFQITEAVAQRSLMNRVNPSKYPYIGTALTDASPVKVNDITYGDGWYKLEVKQTPDLNLEKIKVDYIINYDTGDVVSTKPIYYEDEEFFIASELKDKVGGTDNVISPDRYDEARGVNKPVLVTGMIPVRNINNKWIVTNANDENWYDYSENKDMWANVMLTDEIAVAGYSNEDIRNASLAELEGREVTTSGSMFIWIPRFTSNSIGEICYSNLTKDYTENGFTLSDSFTFGSTELTGIWFSKYDAEYK